MKRSCVVFCFLLGSLLSAAVHAESPKLKTELQKLSAVKGPYTFAVLGDNRSGDRIYKKIISHMMYRKPMFVMNTGDLIPNPGDREEWKNFWAISKPIDVPYFPAAGNHDIDNEESQKIWREEVDLPGNESYYNFTVGKDLYVVLNSCEPDRDRRIEGKQFDWVAKILDPKRYEHQFVFLHHPLFIFTGTHNEGRSLDRYPELRDKLHRLFVDRKVTAVFEGHEHTFSRIDEDGVHYIITGGGGAPLYGRDSFNNFLMVEVDGERIGVKVLDREGVMRSEFLIE